MELFRFFVTKSFVKKTTSITSIKQVLPFVSFFTLMWRLANDFMSKIILLNNPLVNETYHKTNLPTVRSTKKSMHIHMHTNCIHCMSICGEYPWLLSRQMHQARGINLIILCNTSDNSFLCSHGPLLRQASIKYSSLHVSTVAMHQLQWVVPTISHVTTCKHWSPLTSLVAIQSIGRDKEIFLSSINPKYLYTFTCSMFSSFIEISTSSKR